MSKPPKTSKDAKKLSVSLSPEVELALQAIESLRRRKQAHRNTRNEIIEDAIWMLLVEGEKIPREKIEAIIPPKPEHPKKLNVTTIRKKRDKVDS